MLNIRKMVLVLIDIAIFAASVMLAVLLGSLKETPMPLDFPRHLIVAVIFIACILLVRSLFRCYTNVWRYANSRVYLFMVISDTIGGAIALLINYLIGFTHFGIFRSLAIVSIFCVCSLSSRFFYQQYYRYLNNLGVHDLHQIGVAIVGAGQVGSLLAEEFLYNSASHYNPICFIDRDTRKVGSRICGIKVYEESEALIEKLKTMPVQEIIFAIPSMDGDRAKELYDVYSRTGCRLKMYDGLHQGEIDPKSVTSQQIREVRIEDLLFRDSLEINNDKTKEYYSDKVVLITGGGGSIGSELCRQVAKCKPKKLVIFDIYENNAYEIQQELTRQYGGQLDLSVEIGSVRDRARLEAVFACYCPNVVFHAAAHKHVPLMEHSNCEAIKNNVFGTRNVADMSEKHGVEKFILVSTDKAVNPTNIMGATKRMCEMVVLCRKDSKTSFSAVRFGNVLGSNGSVVPLFRRQIEAGGPITITDRRIIRYFMTISEASQLVMNAGAMAKRGELFVLDMGKPVKIIELAENMIRLSGLRPYRDIDIKEIGLRPGEKLYEELLIRCEILDKTENDLIFIEHDTPLSREEVDAKLALLQKAVEESQHKSESQAIKLAMKQAVPTYREPEEINVNASASREMQMAR